jgi:hypothetical protein
MITLLRADCANSELAISADQSSFLRKQESRGGKY